MRQGIEVGAGTSDSVTEAVLVALTEGGAVGAGGSITPTEGSSEGGNANDEKERKNVLETEGDGEAARLGFTATTNDFEGVRV